jgi:bifunctional UDP-N-acetylglucosamine pyrophosphorylase / glucosamine-1-phosphate N-acetyltransferase
MLRPTDFFDLSDDFTAEFFVDIDFVWQVVPHIGRHVAHLTMGKQEIHGDIMPGAIIGKHALYVGREAVIEPGAFIQGPAYIGDGAVVKHGAYVRENVILLPGAVLGHASEAKNSLFLPRAHAPHFNYVGDSILGHRVNLGAGTKLSNLAIISQKDRESGKRPSIELGIEGDLYDTGLAKLGAILGDDVQTGCNSVLNPGCLVGPRTLIYANVSLRKGYHPPDSIIKLRQNIRRIDRRG